MASIERDVRFQTDYNAAMQVGDYSKAEKLVQAFNAKHPIGSRADIMLLDVRIKQGRLEEAYKIQRKLHAPITGRDLSDWGDSNDMMRFAELAEKVGHPEDKDAVVPQLARRARMRDWGALPGLEYLPNSHASDLALALIMTSNRNSEDDPTLDHSSFEQAMKLVPDSTAIKIHAANHYWGSDKPKHALDMFREIYLFGDKAGRDWVEKNLFVITGVSIERLKANDYGMFKDKS